MSEPRCPQCGALIALVGTRHRCIPRTATLIEARRRPAAKRSKPAPAKADRTLKRKAA